VAQKLPLPASIIFAYIWRCSFRDQNQGELFMTASQMQWDEVRPEGLEPPRYEDGITKLIAGLRGHYTRATMNEISGLWQRFTPYLGGIPGQVGGVAYGVCFPSSDGFDYLSGVEVLSSSGLPDGFSVVSMPVQKYAVFSHRGHVSKLHETCDAIEREWLPRSQHAFAHGTLGAPGFFERYGEGFDPRTGSGDVEVWVPIK
jgi:AraC family transcriptional regulator